MGVSRDLPYAGSGEQRRSGDLYLPVRDIERAGSRGGERKRRGG